jgi:anti-sigma factor RsiW
MLCNEFEDRLTDYIDGVLQPDVHKTFAEHALRCPVCHETLSAVKSTMQACHAANSLDAPRDLDARILLSTMPETAMTCEDFEERLTDYLDGFLPAPLFHRWERHSILCATCTELPGEVVRSIGACYTYIGEERPIPAGLNERILLATLGNRVPEEIRAPFGSRVASWLRRWLDPIISPQLATVATMLLVAVFVLTNTVSADGSISGVYSASLRLAEQGYAAGSTGGMKKITKGLKELVGGEPAGTQPAAPKQESGNGQQKQAPKKQNSPALGNGRNRS